MKYTFREVEQNLRKWEQNPKLKCTFNGHSIKPFLHLSQHSPLLEKCIQGMPNTSLNYSNLILPRGLVKILAALSQLLQYSIWISFD